MITTNGNPDDGWRFREPREAIDSLTTGDEHTRQRTYQDALALLSVLVQHGDRKPSQQRLVCRSPLDPAAGRVLITMRASTCLVADRDVRTGWRLPVQGGGDRQHD